MPGFPVFDCRFLVDLSNLSVFYGSIWLSSRCFGFPIACLWVPIGWRISLCFLAGRIDLSRGPGRTGCAASIDGGNGRGGCENSEG